VRVGVLLGVLGVPAAVWRLHDHLSPLPPALLHTRFPLLARLYISRAMWARAMDGKAYYLDRAMARVLASGLGAASPQATALLVYLSQLYCEQDEPDVRHLAASLAALCHKPHVGEGVREERARLEMSFRVAAKLCDLLQHADPARCAEYAGRALDTMQCAPPSVGAKWANHPLKARFARIVNRNS